MCWVWTGCSFVCRTGICLSCDRTSRRFLTSLRCWEALCCFRVAGKFLPNQLVPPTNLSSSKMSWIALKLEWNWIPFIVVDRVLIPFAPEGSYHNLVITKYWWQISSDFPLNLSLHSLFLEKSGSCHSLNIPFRKHNMVLIFQNKPENLRWFLEKDVGVESHCLLSTTRCESKCENTFHLGSRMCVFGLTGEVFPEELKFTNFSS